MIQARGLTKRYDKTTAVDDLSFVAEPGRVTGFLGPNGAGKSTTMRMVLGLDRPTAGDVLVNDRPYRDLRHPLQTVGALLDARWVHPNRSARAHLQWMARSNKLPAARVDEVLEMVGLTRVADKHAGGFSLGMSQRLGIAGALLGDPEILMFDEPVNGLDPEGIQWIRRFMQGLAAEGRTVFVSSHLLSEMALTATHLVVIGRGRLISQCTTEDFVQSASASTVRLRSPQSAEFARILAAEGLSAQPAENDALVVAYPTTDRIAYLAADHGVLLLELAVQNASLEDAFIQVTGHDVEYAGSSRPAEDTAMSTSTSNDDRELSRQGR